MLERRRRQRHAFVALPACGIAAALAYLVVHASGGSLAAHKGQGSSAAAGPVEAQVVPKDPSSLAIGSNGALYIGDAGRHDILMRLPNGRFRVAVGTGVAGVEGDGGSALDAEIEAPQSLLAARGALYIFDGRDTQSIRSGFTAEVRKVAPNGKINTLVGACAGIDASPTAVGRAALETPSGAIGPDGNLYLSGQACGESSSGPVLELTRSGHLVNPSFDSVLKQQSCLPPSGIAFSKSGALYVACDSGQHGKELLIVEPNGSTKAFPGAYPYDAEAGLASTTNGTILAIDYFKVVRVTPRGLHTIINLGYGTHYLGTNGSLLPHGRNASMEPNGIAVDRHGDVYLASTSGFGNGTFTGLIEIHTNGRVQVLWSRPSR